MKICLWLLVKHVLSTARWGYEREVIRKYKEWILANSHLIKHSVAFQLRGKRLVAGVDQCLSRRFVSKHLECRAFLLLSILNKIPGSCY
jgi:hypothetical protein